MKLSIKFIILFLGFLCGQPNNGTDQSTNSLHFFETQDYTWKWGTNIGKTSNIVLLNAPPHIYSQKSNCVGNGTATI